MNTYFHPQPELYGLRVVKYIRCSHEGQVLHGDTLEAQDTLLNEFIEVNHMVLVDTFVDEALTARKRYTKRKEFVRLLDGVRAHAFDMILFTKLDRWFRNIGDYHKIQEILDANSVQWKAIAESYDTTTTNGRLHINIRLSVAQDECDRDSDRIKDVFAYKLKNKSYISGRLPRGLKLDAGKHIIHDPEWKQWALDMFDHFESSGSIYSTFQFLTNKYGPLLRYDGVSRALKNPLYKGMYRDDPEFCDPLIDPERFDHLLELAKKNVRQRKTRRYYIFTGLLVCSSCQHNLVPYTIPHTLADGTHKDYVSYRCGYHSSSRLCDRSRTYREEYIEQYLLDHVRPALSRYMAEYDVVSSSASKKDPAAEAAKIRHKLEKLYDLFLDDLIEKDLYRQKYDELQAQLKECLEVPSAPVRDFSAVQELLSKNWEDMYCTFSKTEKNVFWKSFVESIIVYEDGGMDINFL